MRRFAQAAFDFACWVVAMPLAVSFRYDFSAPMEDMRRGIQIGLIMGSFQVVAGLLLHLYRGRYKFGSFDEVSGVVITAALVGGSITLASMLTEDHYVPRSTPILATGMALTAMLAGRFLVRSIRERRRITRSGPRTIVLGAGEAGDELIKAMLLDPNSDYDPVALLDDDPSKQRLRLHGVPVRGTSNDIGSMAASEQASILVVAIASVDAQQLLAWERDARAAQLTMRVIPSTQDIIGGAVTLGDISNVTEEDLLGRRPIHTEEGGIAAMLAGRRVLITGAGGSIGSELARQVHRYGPAYLGLLDRDESALHAVQLSIQGRALLDSDDLILADIRDGARIRTAMGHVMPDVVIHAAALKHMPMLERSPDEAFKTNVLGTRNVLIAARECGVPIFVNISTDKAADPENVLGYSKKMTERLTAGVQAPIEGRYLSVRFGNVLGSRGSVLTAFRAQIATGGPVTVTDPEVTRYFMTIPEAVHLVLQAATIGSEAETLILDMGTPVRIADVAKHMIGKSGRDIAIVYTGLRKGEKLHEVLAGADEVGERTQHSLITQVCVKPLGAEEVDEAAALSPEAARASMIQATTR